MKSFQLILPMSKARTRRMTMVVKTTAVAQGMTSQLANKHPNNEEVNIFLHHGNREGRGMFMLNFTTRQRHDDDKNNDDLHIR